MTLIKPKLVQLFFFYLDLENKVGPISEYGFHMILFLPRQIPILDLGASLSDTPKVTVCSNSNIPQSSFICLHLFTGDFLENPGIEYQFVK